MSLWQVMVIAGINFTAGMTVGVIAVSVRQALRQPSKPAFAQCWCGHAINQHNVYVYEGKRTWTSCHGSCHCIKYIPASEVPELYAPEPGALPAARVVERNDGEAN